MRQSVRWRLAIPFALFLILSILGLSLILLNAFYQAYLDNIKAGLLDEAHLVANDISPSILATPKPQDINSLVSRYASLLHVRVTIIQADGVVLAESDTDPAAMELHMNRPEVQQALNNQEAFQVRFSSTLKTDMLYVATPLKQGNQVVAIVRLARPLSIIESNIEYIRKVVLYAAIILAVLAFLMAILISDSTMRPLLRLTKAAQQLSDGKYGGALLPVTQDEIGRLTLAFNQMSAQIQSQLETLQREQAKLSSVLEQMMDGVIIVDSDGIVQLINPAAARMFHVRGEDVLGRSLIEAFRHYQIVELWKKCLDKGEAQSMPLTIGVEQLYLQGIAASLGRSLPGNTLLLFQNLSQQRRLETIRQDFVSNVSHELRTPLASLKALAETLQESALEDPPAARRFLERMQVEIDTLSQMVHELLELSRIESGRVPLKLSAVNPCELLNSPVERMRLQAERADLELILNCPAEMAPVQADAERIEQVLVNLLHNAIKFTPPGGKITVSAVPESDRVIFLVQDSGVGIPENDLSRIFERFYKVDRARSGGGTGLGLSIARHIIEAHGGSIWVESIQGQGSTFYFSLPLASNPPSG